MMLKFDDDTDDDDHHDDDDGAVMGIMMTKPYDYDDDTDDDHDHKNDSYTAAGAAPGASVPYSFSRVSVLNWMRFDSRDFHAAQWLVTKCPCFAGAVLGAQNDSRNHQLLISKINLGHRKRPQDATAGKETRQK